MAEASALASGNKLKMSTRFRNGEQPCFSLAITNKIMEKCFCHEDGVCLKKKLNQFGGQVETLDQDSGIRV